MQGFQADPTQTVFVTADGETDYESCYEKTHTLTGKIEEFFSSVIHIDISDPAAPFYEFAETAVSFTDVFTYC